MNTTRGLHRLLFLALLGRFHSTATSVVIGLAMHRWTGSFAPAGLVIAGLVAGQAISAPVRGKMLDHAPIATIFVCGGGYALALGGLGALMSLASPTWWMLSAGAAGVAGALLPPVAPAFRSSVSLLADSDAQMTRILAGEAAAQELIFLAGPPTGVAASVLTSPSWALVMIAGSAGLGSAVFAMGLRTALREAGERRSLVMNTPESRRATNASCVPGRRRPPANLVRLAFGYGLILGSLTTMTLVSVTVAVAAGMPQTAGLLEASIALASLAGGALATRGLLEGLQLPGRAGAMAIALIVLAASTALSQSLLTAGAALAAAGFWIAPTLTLHSLATVRAAPAPRRAEAFGWVSSAGLTISAAMTPLAGLALDRASAPGGAAIAAISMVGAAAVMRRLPNGVGHGGFTRSGSGPRPKPPRGAAEPNARRATCRASIRRA